MQKRKRTRQLSRSSGATKPTATQQQAAQPVSPAQPVDWRGHCLHAGVVLVVLFALYAATMPHFVTFEDSGIFNLACHQGGVAHPPGYPLYSLLCYPFAHLPFISTAVGINLMSALFGAMSCAVLYLIAVWLLGRPGYAYIAAFAYGFCAIFWSQAIIQEVYTLHTLLLFSLFFLALVYRRTGNPQILYWCALLYGLSLSNHWPLMGVATPALLILLLSGFRWSEIQRLGLRTLALSSGFFVLGLAPYLYLVVSANGDALSNFLGPIESVRQFGEYVARVGFSAMDDQGGDWRDRALFAKLLLSDSVTQFGIPALPLIAVGFVWQWRRWGGAVSAALSWTYLTIYVLVVMLSFDFYKTLSQETFLVYAVAAYAAFALWLAAGIAAVSEWLRTKWHAQARLAQTLLYAVAAGVLLNQVAGNAATARIDDRVAYTYATTVLMGLAPNANLLINTSYSLPFLSVGPIDGIRPDVEVFHSDGIFLSNRYVSARISRTEKEIATRDFINTNPAPVYYLRKQPHDYGVEDFGIYKKVRKDLAAGKVVFSYPPGGVKLLRAVSDISPRSPTWNLHFKRYFLGAIARVLVATGINAAETQPYLALMEKDYHGKIALAAEIALTPDASQAEVGLRYLEQAEKQLIPDIPAHDRARIYLYRGVFLTWIGAPLDEVEANLLRSIEINPSPRNSAREKLVQIRAAIGKS